MFISNQKNAPRRRAGEQKKELQEKISDSQELIATLMEQNELLTAENDELKNQLNDVQELTATLIEK